ncbi:MAG: hypothetical protein ACI9FN_003318, partial [Saprospiraceae bacterium]
MFKNRAVFDQLFHFLGITPAASSAPYGVKEYVLHPNSGPILLDKTRTSPNNLH